MSRVRDSMSPSARVFFSFFFFLKTISSYILGVGVDMFILRSKWIKIQPLLFNISCYGSVSDALRWFRQMSSARKDPQGPHSAPNRHTQLTRRKQKSNLMIYQQAKGHLVAVGILKAYSVRIELRMIP